MESGAERLAAERGRFSKAALLPVGAQSEYRQCESAAEEGRVCAGAASTRLLDPGVGR